MRQLLSTAAFLGFVATSGAAFAASPSFTTIDNPGDPTFNQILSIGNNGVIAGYFGSGAAGHPNQAYQSSPPYTSFKPANVTGSVQTQVTTINGPSMAGFWSGTDIGAPNDANYGFISTRLSSGKTETVLVNGGTKSAPAIAQVLGINGSLNAAGFYVDGNGNAHGFVYNVPAATYTPVTISGAKQVTATSINASNLIGGFYLDSAGVTHAFLAPLSGGTPITFTVPGARLTQFLGVNDNGEAVGTYQITPTDFFHGVVYNPANGQWKTVDDPNGVGGTIINGVNNKGQAVGFYTDSVGNVNGMLINNAF